MINWQHYTEKVGEIKLHYVKHGSGPLIIMLHGFPEFWYSWRHQIAELSKYYTVVAPDMRGYGDSDKPEGVKNYRPDKVAGDIINLIKHLGYEKAHIVAHDWGGGIAWNIAQHHPEVIDKLVVLNCPIPAVLGKHLRSNWTQIKKSWYMFFFQLPWLPEKRMSSNLPVFFKRALRGWAKNKQAFSREDIDKYVEAFSKPYALTGAINYYRAAFRSLLKKENRAVKPISVNTLVLWGEDDEALGKELTYDMEKYFTNGFKIEYFENCSHWIQHDYPDKVNQSILNFITIK